MDQWGRDPAVQAMRRVCAAMEKIQGQIIAQAGLSPYDPRLADWRENTLARFERAWGLARRQGIGMDENTAALVYGGCLEAVLAKDGLKIETVLPSAEAGMRRLVTEVMR